MKNDEGGKGMMTEVTPKKPYQVFKNGGALAVTISPLFLRRHDLQKGSVVAESYGDGRLIIAPGSEGDEGSYRIFQNGAALAVSIRPEFWRGNCLSRGSKIRQYLDEKGRLILEAV